MTVGGLFDGCGLLAYGLHLAGWDHAWLCEKDDFRASLLRQRFPGVPVYRDVRDVGSSVEPVSLVAGGFPCKGVSSAGRRQGFGHPETALWREMLRIVRELRPRYVLVENVAALLTRHDGELFAEVLAGLAACGYDAEWDCLPAAAFGASHGRDRVFITALADPRRARLEREGTRGPTADGDRPADDADASAVGRGRLGERADDATRQADPDAERLGRVAGRGLRASDTRGVRRRRPADGRREAVADADGLGWDRQPTQDSATEELDVSGWDDFDGRGVAVEWRRYEGAVRRWEDIVGRPAPEPLIRRVDDGSAARLERSALSALGDGVLVQAGWLVGRRILDYEASLVTPIALGGSH